MYENMYSRWLRNAHQIDLYDFYYGDSDKKEKRKNQRIARTADAPEQWGKMGIVTSVVGEYIN